MTTRKQKWISFFVQLILWGLFFTGLFYAWKYPQVTKRVFTGVSLPQINLGDVCQAIVFLIVVLYVFRFLKNLILKWLEKNPKENKSVYYSMIKLLGYVGWIIGLWGCLSLMGLNLQNLAIIFGALSVGIGFGLQTIVNNFVSGILILFERPISVGDWIRVDGQEGIVKNIHIRATELETFDKCSVLIPNATILSGDVVNVTRQKEGRVTVSVGVSYNSDMHLVEQTLRKCAENLSYAKKSESPIVLMTEFADSSVNFEVRVIIEKATDGLAARHQLMFAIWDALQEKGIEIPFPQRVVHLEK
ncbi:MAG: mechanosensitive ion channel family protein [Alphaproteobacteria bacterium]